MAVDVLVNNVGGSAPGGRPRMSEENLERADRLHLRACSRVQ